MRVKICRRRQPDGADRYAAEWLELTSMRGYLQRSLECSTVLLALVVTALSPAQSFAADTHVALDIQAGQTYTLIDLDPDSSATSHVRRSPSIYAAMPGSSG